MSAVQVTLHTVLSGLYVAAGMEPITLEEVVWSSQQLVRHDNSANSPLLQL